MAADPPPPLDTRTLPDLLAQLRTAARTSLPAWTPPPDGDAGTALHRIFARYVEIALQRLNGVPDKTLLTFLDLMGVSPLPPAPARVPLVFSLAPGAPPALVPAGTRASAPASGARAEVVFETEQDLLVLPAQLVAARTQDPVWDRASDLADLVGPARGPLPSRQVFVGEEPVPHVLHVGDADTLAAGRDVVVSLSFSYRADAPDDEVTSFLQSLVLSCDSGGVVRELPHSTVVTAERTVTFAAVVPATDPRTVSGVGLPAAVTSRWLRLSLPAPLPDAGVPAGLLLEPAGLDVEAAAAPDALLAGTAPLDPTTDFLPFGERPRVGDTFLIRSDQAFVRPLTVSLTFRATAGTPSAGLALAWEYLGAAGWSTVSTTTPEPTPAGTLAADGAVSLTLPPVPVAEVAGQAGRWVRARILAGGYGAPAEYEPVDRANPALGFRVKAGTGNLAPPRLRSLRLSYAARTVPRCVVQTGTFLTEAPAGAGFAPFPGPARLPAAYADPDPALYLGFDRLARQQPVTLYVEVPAAAPGRPGSVTAAAPADPADAVLRWEYYDGDRWRELTVFDGTRGFTVAGTVSLITPADLAPLTRFEPVERVWLRVRAAANDPVGSPRVAAVHVNAVLAAAAVTVADEVLGSSTDQPGQALRTSRQPVQPGQRLLVAEPELLPQDEAVALAAEEGPDAVAARPDPAGAADRVWVRWHEVPSLVGSGPGSRHYTLDRLTGTVRFGDGQRGMIPPRGTANVSISYRCGGGAAGNLGPAAVVQFGTPVPGLAGVTNPVAADGGADAEPLAAVRERGAHVLRHRGRAIAAGDVEWLARQAAGTRIARVVCLSNVDRNFAAAPGWLSVLLVPAGPGATPRPSPGLISEVGDYLAARSPVQLSTPAPGRITLVGPAYVQVTVEADVVPRSLADAGGVTARMVAALDAFLHPVSGGPDGAGWPLGRPVYGSEIAQVLERVPGVSHVKTLALRANQAQRRLHLTGSASPVTPARLPAGTTVRDAAGLRAALLTQAVPAGTQLRRIDVAGFREGDRVTFALDLAVLAAPEAGQPLRVAVAGGRLATGFPRGSVVVAAGGRHRTRLRRGIPPSAPPPAPAAPVSDDVTIGVAIGRPAGVSDDVTIGVRAGGPTAVAAASAGASTRSAGAAAAGERLIELTDMPPLAVGDRLTVLYPFPTAVTAVTTETAGALTLAVDPVPVPAGGLPAGTIVSTVDGLIRSPLAVDAPAGPDGRLDRLPLADFGPGQTVLLGPPGSDPVFTAVADAVAPVTDHVHLDPYVFAYSAGHRIRIAAS